MALGEEDFCCEPQIPAPPGQFPNVPHDRYNLSRSLKLCIDSASVAAEKVASVSHVVFSSQLSIRFKGT